MMPKDATCREKPARSVNMIVHSSPKRSQICWSMASVSAPDFVRASMRRQRRSSVRKATFGVDMAGDGSRWNDGIVALMSDEKDFRTEHAAKSSQLKATFD